MGYQRQEYSFSKEIQRPDCDSLLSKIGETGKTVTVEDYQW